MSTHTISCKREEQLGLRPTERPEASTRVLSNQNLREAASGCASNGWWRGLRQAAGCHLAQGRRNILMSGTCSEEMESADLVLNKVACAIGDTLIGSCHGIFMMSGNA